MRHVKLEENPALHDELHSQRSIDRTETRQRNAEVRQEICNVFGVPYDDAHTAYIQPPANTSPKILERILPAFYVMIDTTTNERLYGEGRTDHVKIVEELIKKANALGIEINMKSFADGLDTDPPRYFSFKGFVDSEAFVGRSPDLRHEIETPIKDEAGNPIDTPKEWFITGTSINS